MGVVYLAIQPVIKKRVAIKVLKPQVAGDELQVRRLIIEAESVNAISHRGIIDIFGMGQLPDGRPYVVMEYLDGQPLDVWVHQQPGGRVSLLTAIELLLEICAALSAAHRANVIHRDLKPSNVFVCKQADGSRYLKLLDFGLAKRAVGLDGNTKQTSQSVVSGTPDYMAPEQARGLPISPRSDIYALGVIAFELFTGRVPFSGDTPMDVMVAHVGAAVPSAREVEPSLTEDVDALVRRMLAKSPDARPQSVDDVRTALEDIVVALGQPRPRSSREYPAYVSSASPVPAAPPSGTATPAKVAAVPEPAPPLPAERRRRPVLGALVGAVVVTLIAGPLIYFSTRPAEQVVVPAPEVVVAPADVVPQAVVDAGLPEPEVVVATEAIDAGVVEVVVETKKTPARPPSTAKQLRVRIAQLEARAKKKKNLDPTALQFLSRYKIEATAADTAARRAKLEKALSDWEKTFLLKR